MAHQPAALMAPEAQTVLTKESREVARKTLNIGSLARVVIPVAPLEEMKEVLRRVTLHLAAYKRQLEAVSAAREQLDQLERATLSRAFRGRLVSQDSDDEPAEKLLARLRAARGSTAPAGRRPRAAARP